jgi:TRAP-type C4-dicarboxylate transport system substrate-binding protein
MKKIVKEKQISRRDFLKKSAKLGGAAAVGLGSFYVPKFVWGRKILRPVVAATAAKPGMPMYNQIMGIPKIMDEKYGIQMTFNIHHSSVLGSSIDAVDAAINGFVDIGVDSVQNFSTFSNAFAWAALPFVFKDSESACKLFESDLMEEPKEQVRKELKGGQIFSIRRGGGWRILWNSERELRVPDDVRGLKFRATASPIAIALIKNWGGSPVPIPFKEIYTATQQGVVKGVHLQPMWFYPFSFYEIMEYGTEVNAIFSVSVHLLNGRTWNMWPKDVQEAFMKASLETTRQTNEQDMNDEINFKKLIQEKGVKIYTPTSDEFKKWKQKGMTIWDSAPKHGVDPKFLDKILDYQGISRA